MAKGGVVTVEYMNTLGFNRVVQTQGDSGRDRKTRQRAGHKARYRQSPKARDKRQRPSQIRDILAWTLAEC